VLLVLTVVFVVVFLATNLLLLPLFWTIDLVTSGGKFRRGRRQDRRSQAFSSPLAAHDDAGRTNG